MIRKIHILLLSALGLLIATATNGAVPPIRNFSREATGGGAQNWSIAQGEGGVMYFANNNGVLSFNSRDWSLRRMQNGTSVRSLRFDPERHLLYAGASGELECFSEKEVRSLLEGAGSMVSEIWNIYIAGEGIVFQDDHAFYRLSAPGEVRRYDAGGRISTSACIGGNVIASLQGGPLVSFSGGQVQPVPGTEPLGKFNIRSICEADGDILIITEGDGIWRYSSLTLSRVETFCPRDIFCAAVSDDCLALGTISDGLWIMWLKEGRTLHLNTASGLQKNTVLSLFFDREDNLWAGLDNGIDYICLNASEWKIFGERDPIGTGYTSATYAGWNYFGTSQGLFRARGFDEAPVSQVGGIRWQVWSLDLYDGTLFCSHDRGLDILQPDGSSERIPLNGCWKVEPLRRHPGFLLGCTYDRLFTVTRKGGKWRFNGYLEGFDESSKAIEEDYDGSIWFSHHIKGLYRLQLSEDLSRVEKAEPFSTGQGFPTGRNNYPNEYAGGIVFSTEGGYFRYDGISGRAVPVDALNGLFTSTPTAAKVVRLNDSLEVFSSGAIQTIRFRRSDGEWITDSLSVKHLATRRPLGFESFEFIPGRGLLVNTDEGFSLIDIERLKKKTTRNEPAVFISQADLSSGSENTTVYSGRRPSGEGRIVIPFRRRSSMTFSFICPQYEREGGISYSCFLEGYDKDWVDLGSSTGKEYTHLPDGEYTFRVRADSDADGHITEDSIRLIVTPPFYKSTAALLLYLVLLSGAILGIVKLVQVLSVRRAGMLTRKREEELLREQTQLELRHRADDLAASTSNLIRKNEILTTIDADLEKLKDFVSPGEGRNALRKIRTEIRENIAHDDDWQKFSTHFDLVYDNFISRLGKKYPVLSTSDKRLSAYLKMGLCSKDIAPLMNMTVRSVEMTRYRLRQKIGLSREENLVKFLQDF